MERILFRNATLVTLDRQTPLLRNCNLTVCGEKIESIGGIPTGTYTRVIDASHWVLMPGLVNAHTHTPMTLLRGLKDDCPPDLWLKDFIWPAESSLTAEDFYYGALLGMAEAIATGTTSISDMYRSSSALVRAAVSCGIKANICESITCGDNFSPTAHPGISESVRMVQDWNGYDHGRIRCDTSIQSCWQTIPELWAFISDFAQQQSIGIHIHLAETKAELAHCQQHYKRTPVQCLANAGVFQNRVVAAHGIYLTPEDLDLIAASNTYLVHDPGSNLKCCCGFAHLHPCFDRGIPVALGTDGVCSNNSGDMFGTLKLTALLQKMLEDDPCFLSSEQCLHMAIHNGLASQGRVHEAGILCPGLDADLIAVDLDFPSMQPVLSPTSSLVYAASGAMVRLNMVRGRILYENGTFTTIDMEHLTYQTQKIAMRLCGQAALSSHAAK